MPYREVLSYEKREEKTLSTITGAADIDEALKSALHAIYDAQSFREYAKATGTDVVKTVSVTKKEFDWGWAAICFVFGIICCLLVLMSLGVI